MMFELFLDFFQNKNKKGGAGKTQPLRLSHNWPGPNQGLINWLAACKNEFCMQHPQRGRRGKAGRRKLPDVGDSVMMRWFGRWLRVRRLR